MLEHCVLTQLVLQTTPVARDAVEEFPLALGPFGLIFRLHQNSTFHKVSDRIAELSVFKLIDMGWLLSSLYTFTNVCKRAK